VTLTDKERICGPILSPRQRPRICFVAPNAYDLLSGREDICHTGGAEVQQVLIASWLVQEGYAVSLVTLDHGQPDRTDREGIRMFKAYSKEAGIRGLRFIHPRWSGLWRAMARADADVYYQRGAEYETGQVGLWCRLHGRRFIFAAANDSDCSSPLYALTSWRERWLYRLGLRLAHAVTAQTRTQQRLLRENMGVDAVVVRNCGQTSAADSSCQEPPTKALGIIRVLWVGRITEQKRLEWLLDLAERCPEITFDVVGAANADSDYASSLVERAAGIPNVRMHGRVPYSEVTRYYQGCRILCCTSVYEGFPNTFLEAWSQGVPVVSTFDPDGVIAANGLGWVPHDVEGIVACLRELARAPGAWRKASHAAKQYYLANHTPDACLPAFERLLLEVAGFRDSPA